MLSQMILAIMPFMCPLFSLRILSKPNYQLQIGILRNDDEFNLIC